MKFLVVQTVKAPVNNAGIPVDPGGKILEEMATPLRVFLPSNPHMSEEPPGLQSTGSSKEPRRLLTTSRKLSGFATVAGGILRIKLEVGVAPKPQKGIRGS